MHFEDVKNLLGVLHRLVDQGNTMIVLEHNLDVIPDSSGSPLRFEETAD